MRPYFVLCAVLLVSVVALAQRPIPPRIYTPGYGYGPFVPLATTPMLSLDQYSPNPYNAASCLWTGNSGTWRNNLANAGVDQETRQIMTGHGTKAANDDYTHLELPKLRNAVGCLPDVDPLIQTEAKPA